jgi:hypothetical protein
MSFSRSDEEMAVRDAVALEVKGALERAQLGVQYGRNPGMPYCALIAYQNYGHGWQRKILVCISDDGTCSVYMSPLYDVPKGATGERVDVGQFPFLFSLPRATPNLGEELVRRVREASVSSTESVPSRLIPLPVPLTELCTLSDLIDTYEKYRGEKPYGELLVKVLQRVGKVVHRDRDWWLISGSLISYAESSDAESATRTKSTDIDLAPYLSGNE